MKTELEKQKRLKEILEKEYGITTRKQLDKALAEALSELTIGIMTTEVPDKVHTA